MGKYIVKRVLQFIPVFLGVTLILFALQNIVPGDPIKLIGGDKALSPEVELQLRVRYHLVQTDEDGNAILDENGDPVQTSLVDRYLYYMNGLLHGDLGNSYQRKLPVTEIFAQKYPYTVKLAACAIVLEAIMGIGAGYHFGGKALFLLGYFGNADHVDPRCRSRLLARHAAAAVLRRHP